MPVYTTSMPASRRARATTFAPRSWPSRPGLAIITLIFRSSLIRRQTSPYGDYIARHQGGARLVTGVAAGGFPPPGWGELDGRGWGGGESGKGGGGGALPLRGVGGGKTPAATASSAAR